MTAADCNIYSTLIDAHQRTKVILTSSDGRQDVTNLTLLRSKVRVLSGNAIPKALAEDLQGTNQRLAIDAWRTMERLATSSPEDVAALRSGQDRAGWIRTLEESVPVLNGLKCDNTESVALGIDPNRTIGGATGGAAGALTEDSESVALQRNTLAAVGVGLMGLLGWLGWHLWCYFLRIKRRKAKRYHFDLQIAFATGASNYLGYLRDIRPAGIAFSHDGDVPLIRDHTIKVYVAGVWLEGKIARVRKNFCAVALLEELSQDQVTAMRQAAKEKVNLKGPLAPPIENLT